MRHDIESCDQGGEDQDKTWLDGPVASEHIQRGVVLARPIVLIPHLYRLADAIIFTKDYSPLSSPPSQTLHFGLMGQGALAQL